MELVNWYLSHQEEIKEIIGALTTLYFAIVGVASLIVKITPTLKDDTMLKNIVRFMGKYIALNR